MGVDFAVRFEPEVNGDIVPAHTYIKALEAVFEGLESLRNSTARLIAEKLHLPTVAVRETLEVGVGAAWRGSVVVPIVMGAGVPGVVFDKRNLVESSFWRYSAHVLRSSAAGRQTLADMPAFGAERFALAARAAKNGNCRLGLVQRVDTATRSQWRSLVDLTRLEAGLRTYAERRSTTHMVKARLIGRVTSIAWDPPGFVLQIDPESKRTLTMAASLRPAAQKYWGQEVMVDVEAELTFEGEIRGAPRALELTPVISADTLLADFDRSFGARRQTWGTAEAEEYVKGLRRPPRSD